MGYKKYSPFLKSVKVLILLSFVYFTTRLEAVSLSIPVTGKKFNYNTLPVYCKPSTGFFECKDNNGSIYCLPDTVKCKVHCANDEELKCPHTGTACSLGTLQCLSSSALTCLPETQLCDGVRHCDNGEDELPDVCNSRSCSAGHFACRSPGHCILASQRCDGRFDCQRDGLEDKSDEENCGNATAAVEVAAACGKAEFRCDGQRCLPLARVCDGVPDCQDGSDEASCLLDGVEGCGSGDLLCDGGCVKGGARCDGRADCLDGSDEAACGKNCQISEFFCKFSNSCVTLMGVCDGHVDCRRGDDEVCPVKHKECSKTGRWTCKSGSHCVPTSAVCDGLPHCPDGSDEQNCPTPLPTTPPACPPGRHRCNGTAAVCVDIAEACSGADRCPQPDSELARSCRLLRQSINPCSDKNGGCSQLCVATVTESRVVAECRCLPGFHGNGSGCADVDECRAFGACSQLCSNTPGSFRCSCRRGYSRHGNRCHAHGAAKILVATRSAIQYVDSDTLAVVPVVSGLDRPVCLSHDVAGKRVFFGLRDGTVGVVGLDGTGRRVIQRELAVSSLAYDWTRRLLFYAVNGSASRPGHVGVVHVASGRRARLRSLNCPTALAVVPQRRQLLVALACGDVGIASVGMDGAAFKKIVGANDANFRRVVGHSVAPGRLAVDLAASPNRVFWVDLGAGHVCSARIDGGGVERHRAMLTRPDRTSDIGVLADRVYISNANDGTVGSFDRLTGGDLQTLLAGTRPQALTLHHSLLQPHSEPGSCSGCPPTELCITNVPGAAAACLCDSLFGRRDNAGRCVPIARTARPPAQLPGQAPDTRAEPAPDTPAEQTADAGESLDSVGLIASVAVGALAVCALAGVAVACRCLRQQDSVAVAGKRQWPGMPKVDSRTPLTLCEVDVDNTPQTSSNSSSSSRF